jgi:photosystem II stability/assembly factor-like uncharacterized protein
MKKILYIFFTITFYYNISFSQWYQIATINTTQLNCIKFFNEFTGITGGDGGIWRSSNSGINWTQVYSGSRINALSFPDNNTGYAVGDSGKIIKTSDNGLNWTQLSYSTTNNLYGVYFFTTNVGHAVGQNGVILRTQNGGLNWITQFNPLSEDLNAIIMLSTLSACGVGSVNYERFIITGNGGVNWTYTINVGGNNLRSLSTINGSKIEVVGTNGIIRYSTNGGTWTLIPSGTTMQLNSITFPDTNTGYIAGNNGIILKSINGGMNWVTQSGVTSNNLKSLSFINTTTGWTVGQNGVVLRIGIPVGIAENDFYKPEYFKLYQNYPNPFNSQTKIIFEISNRGNVDISIFSLEGKKIESINNKELQTGIYYFIWNASNFPSGVYFIKAMFGNYVISKKILLVK